MIIYYLILHVKKGLATLCYGNYHENMDTLKLYKLNPIFSEVREFYSSFSCDYYKQDLPQMAFSTARNNFLHISKDKNLISTEILILVSQLFLPSCMTIMTVDLPRCI